LLGRGQAQGGEDEEQGGQRRHRRSTREMRMETQLDAKASTCELGGYSLNAITWEKRANTLKYAN